MTLPLIFRYNDAAISFKTLGNPASGRFPWPPIPPPLPRLAPRTATPTPPASATAPREHFASRLGFILISAGCAIGLGNVWRFPYIAGEYGGAAFIVLYLIFLVILGQIGRAHV